MMTGAELTVLGWGIGLLFAYGVVHAGGLELIRWLQPRQDRHRFLALLVTFWGLAVLHMVEIGIGALVLSHLLTLPDTGMLSNGVGSELADRLHFAGSAYTTLGATQLEAHGAIRLIVMMLALSGFMLITWSATFLYTIWGEIFRD